MTKDTPATQEILRASAGLSLARGETLSPSCETAEGKHHDAAGAPCGAPAANTSGAAGRRPRARLATSGQRHAGTSKSQSDQAREERKGIQAGKEEKNYLCSQGIRKNLIVPQKKLLGLINQVSKIAGFEVNTRKKLCFYPQPKKEINKTAPFTTASKGIKCLRRKLTLKVTRYRREKGRRKRGNTVHLWMRPLIPPTVATDSTQLPPKSQQRFLQK